MRKIKPFEKLEFYDDFMFGLVMQDKNLCREVLECLLGIKIRHLEYAEPQKHFKPMYTARGIRLDVYVKDGNTFYDVEIQNRNENNLGKRTRYYQSMIDADNLLKGEKYSKLKRSVIVFLCRFDPFKKGFPWYTVTRICHEDSSIELADAEELVIFNCTAYEKVVNLELVALLKFIQTGKPESDLTWRLDAMVRKQKALEENKHVYYIWSLHDQDVMLEGEREGRRLGRKEGIKLGEQKGIESTKLENARKLLAMKLGTHEQISEAVGLPLEKIEELAAKI